MIFVFVNSECDHNGQHSHARISMHHTEDCTNMWCNGNEEAQYCADHLLTKEMSRVFNEEKV